MNFSNLFRAAAVVAMITSAFASTAPTAPANDANINRPVARRIKVAHSAPPKFVWSHLWRSAVTEVTGFFAVKNYVMAHGELRMVEVADRSAELDAATDSGSDSASESAPNGNATGKPANPPPPPRHNHHPVSPHH